MQKTRRWWASQTEEVASCLAAMRRIDERTILHSDGNNFFASIELLARPELRDEPVAIAGDPERRHGVVVAKNEVAKRYGVQTAETVWSAMQKCPGLKLLKPHYEKYREMYHRINRIYRDYSARVEPFSIDESAIDATDWVAAELARLRPVKAVRNC